ncbi:DNA repair protein RadC [Candidatus Woesearchaeota archaeon]|jgi:DNA repair protein RadC|nr:DNA repair protein RadC [Candidatus Woesearchaeota archaeon]MBT7237653.1 DNA repair protein RadC [Candidatus Woesearchaeota archaeon]
MKIKDLPSFNKPSSKLLKQGASSLDTAELLSIIFGKGDKKESALEISNRLLKKYNLHKFEELGFTELLKECNNDIGKAFRIQALIELSKRYNKLVNHGYKRKITSAKDVYDYFVDSYGKRKKEYFLCLYLDTKNFIIKDSVVSVGTLNSSLVHPREVFKSAIKESANSIILVHNHPSGDCSPSSEDERVTEIFREAGELLGISVLDHVIVGKCDYWSWKENN